MKARTQLGFSLLELMVTVMIVGILLGVGVPSFRAFQRGGVMTAAANDLVGNITLARAEAIKRQVPITVCASMDSMTANPTCGVGPSPGYIVFVDDANPLLAQPTDGNAVVDPGELVLAQHAPPGGTLTIFADTPYLAFGPSGFRLAQAVGQAQPSLTTLLLCDDRGNEDAGGTSAARVVTVSPTGRAQILRSQADVIAAVAATGGVCP
jgi:type IV fimbrial biogenesis protein FimT